MAYWQPNYNYQTNCEELFETAPRSGGELLMPPPFPPPATPPQLHVGAPSTSLTPRLPPFDPSLPPPPLFQQASPSLPFNKQTFGKESLGGEKFMRHLEDKYRNILKNESGSTEAKIKVSMIKEKFIKCFELMEQLESVANCLQLAAKSLPEDQWMKYCDEVDLIKGKLECELKDLNHPETLKIMKKVIDLRKRKREYRKRKVKEWQEEKRERKTAREEEERRIDLWLEKMKDQVARAKREEDIKREADLVLGDVRRRLGEAKRILSLLNSLSRLRAGRAGAQAHISSASLVSSQDASTTFNEIIDRLKKMWTEQINGYRTEEEGLKVMLGHAEEERLSLEAARLRSSLKDWYRAILGSFSSSSSSSLQPASLHQLVQIRNEWDKFISADDAAMASSIPIGWVLPAQPSSPEWAQYLNTA